jgi:anti-sigma B factor antagonist
MIACRSGQDRPMTGKEAIDVQIEGGRARAAVAGDFDMQATFSVEPALEAALDHPQLDALEIDLSRLRFIDSTGVGVLLRVDGEARDRGISLSIVPAPPEVQRVFAISGVEDALPFAPLDLDDDR